MDEDEIMHTFGILAFLTLRREGLRARGCGPFIALSHCRNLASKHALPWPQKYRNNRAPVFPRLSS